MKTFDLTHAEFRVARQMVADCLDGMGGERPADLEHDEYTWIDPADLIARGYTRHQVAGFYSSLNEKGFIEDTGEPATMESNIHWIVSTAGWQWMETQWDKEVI